MDVILEEKIYLTNFIKICFRYNFKNRYRRIKKIKHKLNVNK